MECPELSSIDSFGLNLTDSSMGPSLLFSSILSQSQLSLFTFHLMVVHLWSSYRVELDFE